MCFLNRSLETFCLTKDVMVSSTKEATIKVTVFNEEDTHNTVDNLGFEFK